MRALRMQQRRKINNLGSHIAPKENPRSE